MYLLKIAPKNLIYYVECDSRALLVQMRAFKANGVSFEVPLSHSSSHTIDLIRLLIKHIFNSHPHARCLFIPTLSSFIKITGPAFVSLCRKSEVKLQRN